MPNPAKGARLYLRKRKGRSSVFVIRDSGCPEISTGFGPSQRSEAEGHLAAYIAAKYTRPTGQRDPAEARIADVIAHYIETRADETADPIREGTAASRLLDFCEEDVVDKIDRLYCGRYVKARVAQGVATGTARRELEMLQASLNLSWKDKLLTSAPFVHMPPKAPPRDRWLTKAEADRLLAAAEELPRGGWHVSTFIRIGLMTGTRRTSILNLQWEENLTGGYIDLKNGILYRRARHAAETRKRQPPCKIPVPLIPFLEEQKKRTRQYAVEYRGKPIKDIRGGLEAAAAAADVPGVTPHVFRHTCCTWLAQDGVPTFEASGLVGMSTHEFERSYAHHHPDHMKGAHSAIESRWA